MGDRNLKLVDFFRTVGAKHMRRDRHLRRATPVRSTKPRTLTSVDLKRWTGDRNLMLVDFFRVGSDRYVRYD